MTNSSKMISEVMSEYFSLEDAAEPVRSTVPKEIPIEPQKIEWTKKAQPERLERTFEFDSRQRLTDFVNEVFLLEDRIGHHGTVVVSHKRCKISVRTTGLASLTSLDTEYSRSISAIYRDVLSYVYTN